LPQYFSQINAEQSGDWTLYASQNNFCDGYTFPKVGKVDRERKRQREKGENICVKISLFEPILAVFNIETVLIEKNKITST